MLKFAVVRLVSGCCCNFELFNSAFQFSDLEVVLRAARLWKSAIADFALDSLAVLETERVETWCFMCKNIWN